MKKETEIKIQIERIGNVTITQYLQGKKIIKTEVKYN